MCGRDTANRLSDSVCESNGVKNAEYLQTSILRHLGPNEPRQLGKRHFQHMIDRIRESIKKLTLYNIDGYKQLLAKEWARGERERERGREREREQVVTAYLLRATAAQKSFQVDPKMKRESA